MQAAAAVAQEGLVEEGRSGPPRPARLPGRPTARRWPIPALPGEASGAARRAAAWRWSSRSSDRTACANPPCSGRRRLPSLGRRRSSRGRREEGPPGPRSPRRRLEESLVREERQQREEAARGAGPGRPRRGRLHGGAAPAAARAELAGATRAHVDGEAEGLFQPSQERPSPLHPSVQKPHGTWTELTNWAKLPTHTQPL